MFNIQVQCSYLAECCLTVFCIYLFSTAGSAEYQVEFASCQTRSCVNVSIADDLISEPGERFTISLTKASSFVTPGTVEGEVVVADDDGMEVVIDP